MFLVLNIPYNVKIRESFILKIYPKCIDVRQIDNELRAVKRERESRVGAIIYEDRCMKNKIFLFIINCSQVMTTRTSLLLLTMVAIVLFLANNFASSVPINASALTDVLEELFLPSHLFPLFADHGQEVSIMLDSAQFIPLTTGKGNQVNILLNYEVNDPSIINNQINSVMKVY